MLKIRTIALFLSLAVAAYTVAPSYISNLFNHYDSRIEYADSDGLSFEASDFSTSPFLPAQLHSLEVYLDVNKSLSYFHMDKQILSSQFTDVLTPPPDHQA